MADESVRVRAGLGLTGNHELWVYDHDGMGWQDPTIRLDIEKNSDISRLNPSFPDRFCMCFIYPPPSAPTIAFAAW
jgi:hypothetical protein